MHTTSVGPWAFHHNGGLDGDVIITRTDGESVVVDGDVRVPAVALAEFIGSWINDERIAQLEQQSGLAALGIAEPAKLAELAELLSHPTRPRR